MSSDKDMLIFLRERKSRLELYEVGERIMNTLQQAAGEDWDGTSPPTIEILPSGVNLIFEGETDMFSSLGQAFDVLEERMKELGRDA